MTRSLQLLIQLQCLLQKPASYLTKSHQPAPKPVPLSHGKVGCRTLVLLAELVLPLHSCLNTHATSYALQI